MVFLAADASGSQPAAFTGKDFEWSEQFNTLADARAYVDSVVTGERDPFLGYAWTGYTLKQNRNPNGTFAPGFTVVFTGRRPAAGESYQLGEVPFRRDDFQVEL